MIIYRNFPHLVQIERTVDNKWFLIIRGSIHSLLTKENMHTIDLKTMNINEKKREKLIIMIKINFSEKEELEYINYPFRKRRNYENIISRELRNELPSIPFEEIDSDLIKKLVMTIARTRDSHLKRILYTRKDRKKTTILP